MDSNKLTATILVLSLLAYSTFTEANGSCPPPAPKPTPPPTPKPSPTPPAPKPTPPTPKPSPTPPSPKATPPPTPKPCPTLTPPPPQGHCPKDTLKLGVCADLLGVVNVIIGTPPSSECCALIKGLADLEAALCLCTAIKANVLGINLNVPITLSLILSACEKTIPPPGFHCP